jgi:hypothetical protein
MTAPAGYRMHDGFEFPGDPETPVLIVYRNGAWPKDQPLIAKSRRWLQRQAPHDFDIKWWRRA